MLEIEDRPADEALAFRMTFIASAEDIDELGHVSNIAYVRWLQDAATRHSAAVGLELADYLRLGGVFVVRRRHRIHRAGLRGRHHHADHVGLAHARRKLAALHAHGRKRRGRAGSRWNVVGVHRPRDGAPHADPGSHQKRLRRATARVAVSARRVTGFATRNFDVIFILEARTQ
jgi:acyl-CoA thioesterase FadM